MTILNESGVPTPVVHTKIRAPRSKMAAAADVDGAAKASPLFAKYGTRVDAQSAREMLAARMAAAAAATAPDRGAQEGGEGIGRRRRRGRATSSSPRTGRQLEREVVRGLFGLLSKSLK